MKRYLVFVLLISACGDGGGPGPRDAAVLPDGAVWEGWPPCDESAETQTVTFVHVNDLHATYAPDGPGDSPAARLRGYYELTRLESPYTVFTHGGDAYEKGSVAELLTDGAATRWVAHEMEFDVAVMGNHDFAWSLEETLAFSWDPHGVMLASNLEYTGSDATGFGGTDFAVIEVGCLRIGFFGMVARGYDEHNEETDIDFYPELPARHDHVALAREIVQARGPEVDLMVMVSHLGVDEDLAVAEEVPGIHVILGGHSHDQVMRATTGGTVVIQAGSYACCAVRLDLQVDLATGEVTDRNYDLAVNDPYTMPVSGELQTLIEDIMLTHAPDADVDLAWVASSRNENQIAAVAARAALHHLLVDAAVVDPYTVWNVWEPGPLNQQDFVDTFEVERQLAGTPGFSAFYLADVSGEDLDLIRTSLPAGWAYEGEPAPLPGETYLVALPKYAALNPEQYLPAGVTVQDPVPAAEVWEALDRFARFRTDNCLHLDDDTALPQCR